MKFEQFVEHAPLKLREMREFREPLRKRFFEK